MDRMQLCAALAAALMLGACERTQAPPGDADPAPAASPAVPPPEPAPSATANTSDGVPDLSPPLLTPEAERGVEGARNVLLSFARMIELQEYGQAWSLLSPADREKWSRADFAAIFAGLGETTVAIPDGTMEGAAGSSYYTAPVTVTGADADGRPVRIAGEAVLRRVNDVDGASPEQLRWHFERLTLDWTH